MLHPSYRPLQELNYPQFLQPSNHRTTGNKKKEKTNSAVSTRRSSSDSLDLNIKFKTELCKYFAMGSDCPFGYLCCFAHGEEELRTKESIPMKYKTKLCSKFTQEDSCPYGQRCQFIHPTPSSGSKIIKYSQVLNQVKNDPTLFFQIVDLRVLTRSPRPSFLDKLSSDEFQQQFSELSSEEETSLVYESDFFNYQSQVVGHRGRYNSF